MPNKWICWKCKELNNQGAGRCYKCNGLKLFHGHDVIKIESEGKLAYVRQPTIMDRSIVLSRNSSAAMSHCPSCNKLIFANDKACIHCHYFLSDEELKERSIKNVFNISFYFQSLFLCILILFFLYMLFQ